MNFHFLKKGFSQKFLLLIILIFSPLFIFQANGVGLAGSYQVASSLGSNYNQNYDETNKTAPPKVVLPGNLDTVYEGEKINIQVAKADADGDLIFYYWNASQGNFTTTDPIRFTEVTWQAPEVEVDGVALIYVMASDGRGLTTESRFYIKIKNRSSEEVQTPNPDEGFDAPDVSGLNLIDPKVEIDQFPRVKVSFGLKKEGKIFSDLLARYFSIVEEGQYNKSPLVVLPPKATSSQVDLFVLIDLSGNSRQYQNQIKANLKSLITYMKESGVDFKVNLSTFSNNSKDTDFNFESFLLNFDQLEDRVTTFQFDEDRLSRGHLLGHLFYFAHQASASRPNAEKVALVINSSPFHANEIDPAVQFSEVSMIKKLIEQKFSLFVVGQPLKQVYRIHTNRTDVGNLVDSVPGGYLGSYNADLTQVYDLIKSRTAERYQLMFYSKFFSPSKANGKTLELGALNYRFLSHQYTGLTSSLPAVKSLPLKSANPEFIDVEIEVEHKGQLVNAVEIAYAKKNGSYFTGFMQHRRSLSDSSFSRYYAQVPRSELYDNFKYTIKVITPEHVADFNSDDLDLVDLAYDDGIELSSQIVTENGQKKVLWRWSGSTVNMGESYELWGGDQLIAEIKEKETRHYAINADQCNQYQVVKLRVLLPKSVSHIKAGGWSDFSKIAERFIGEEKILAEKEVMNIGLSCLKNKVLNDISSIDSLNPGLYSADRPATLNKALSYLTGMMGEPLHKQTRPTHFIVIYHYLNYLTSDEFNHYWNEDNKLKSSTLYKVITQINQSHNFDEDYSHTVDKVRGIRRGGSSI